MEMKFFNMIVANLLSRSRTTSSQEKPITPHDLVERGTLDWEAGDGAVVLLYAAYQELTTTSYEVPAAMFVSWHSRTGRPLDARAAEIRSKVAFVRAALEQACTAALQQSDSALRIHRGSDGQPAIGAPPA